MHSLIEAWGKTQRKMLEKKFKQYFVEKIAWLKNDKIVTEMPFMVDVLGGIETHQAARASLRDGIGRIGNEDGKSWMRAFFEDENAAMSYAQTVGSTVEDNPFYVPYTEGKETRDNTHNRSGVVAKLKQHDLKSKQDHNAIKHMSRDYKKDIPAWEDVKKESVNTETVASNDNLDEEEIPFGVTRPTLEKEVFDHLDNYAAEATLGIGDAEELSEKELEDNYKSSMMLRRPAEAILYAAGLKAADPDYEMSIDFAVRHITNRIRIMLEDILNGIDDSMIKTLEEAPYKELNKSMKHSFSENELEWGIFFKAILKIKKDAARATIIR